MKKWCNNAQSLTQVFSRNSGCQPPKQRGCPIISSLRKIVWLTVSQIPNKNAYHISLNKRAPHRSRKQPLNLVWFHWNYLDELRNILTILGAKNLIQTRIVVSEIWFIRQNTVINRRSHLPQSWPFLPKLPLFSINHGNRKKTRKNHGKNIFLVGPTAMYLVLLESSFKMWENTFVSCWYLEYFLSYLCFNLPLPMSNNKNLISEWMEFTFFSGIIRVRH